MPALFFKSTAEFETHQVSEADKAKTRDRRSTSFLNKNGWSIAQNFKVFSSRVARAIAGTEPPDRPQFKLDYHRAPESPVALLVGDPITKFLAACREDRLSPTVALESMQKGLYPSLHFLPQARYTLEHSQPVYLWRATEHVTDFWQTLALGAAPEILPTSRFPEEIEFLAAHEPELREIYSEDFALYAAADSPGKLYTPAAAPRLLTMMANFYSSAHRFARSGFATTPPDILASREATCRACPEWDAEALNKTGRCRKCGCSTWAKLRMATEVCPIGKWKAVSAAP
jgi:hypothetical protein